MNILAPLKYPKIIFGIIGIAITFGVIWYGMNLLEDKGALEEQLRQKEEQAAQMRSTLEQERERFQRTISNYDDVMSSYLEQLSNNQRESQRLRQTISRLSTENERLGQCFNEQVPQELIDRIWEGQQ